MDNYPKDPFLRILLLRKVKDYLFPISKTSVINYKSKYNMLMSHQQDIGWDKLLYGRFTQEWKELAQNHLQTIPKKQQKKTITGAKYY